MEGATPRMWSLSWPCLRVLPLLLILVVVVVVVVAHVVMRRKKPLRKLGAMLPRLHPLPAPTLLLRVVSSQLALAPLMLLHPKALLMKLTSPLLQQVQLKTARLRRRRRRRWWNLPQTARRHGQASAGIATTRNRSCHLDRQRPRRNRGDRERQASTAAVAASLGLTAIEGLAEGPTEGLTRRLGREETLHRRPFERRRGEGVAIRAGRGCAPVSSRLSPAGIMPQSPR